MLLSIFWFTYNVFLHLITGCNQTTDKFPFSLLKHSICSNCSYVVQNYLLNKYAFVVMEFHFSNIVILLLKSIKSCSVLYIFLCSASYTFYTFLIFFCCLSFRYHELDLIFILTYASVK